MSYTFNDGLYCDLYKKVFHIQPSDTKINEYKIHSNIEKQEEWDILTMLSSNDNEHIEQVELQIKELISMGISTPRDAYLYMLNAVI